MNTDLTRAQQPTGMQAVVAGEIDIQIQTAKAYPRDIKSCLNRALTLATMDTETASSCIYSLPRAGRNIEGETIRMAEIMMSSYGNLRVGARVVEVVDHGSNPYVLVEGACHDLEANVAQRCEVRRKVHKDKRGNYDTEIAIGAAQSIARRNAILAVIPRALVRSIMPQIREVALGKAETLAARRQKIWDWLLKAGALAPNILARVDRPSFEDLDREAVMVLTTIGQQIHGGETAVDDAFPAPRKRSTTGRTATNLGEQLATDPPEEGSRIPEKIWPAVDEQPATEVPPLEKPRPARKKRTTKKKTTSEPTLGGDTRQPDEAYEAPAPAADPMLAAARDNVWPKLVEWSAAEGVPVAAVLSECGVPSVAEFQTCGESTIRRLMDAYHKWSKG